MTFDELTQKLEEQGLQSRSYSGRGMYGKECVGASLRRHEHPGDIELPAGWRSDSMGLGTIVYWPSVAWRE